MGYIVDGKEYSYDSSKNQRIKSDFVNKEVYSCVSSMVEYILSQDDRDAPFTRDDIEKGEVKVCEECNRSGHIEEVCVDEVSITPNEDNWFVCPSCELEYGTEDEARTCCECDTLYKCQHCNKLYNEDAYNYLDEGQQYDWSNQGVA